MMDTAVHLEVDALQKMPDDDRDQHIPILKAPDRLPPDRVQYVDVDLHLDPLGALTVVIKIMAAPVTSSLKICYCK
jgi:hypothetical protein